MRLLAKRSLIALNILFTLFPSYVKMYAMITNEILVDEKKTNKMLIDVEIVNEEFLTLSIVTALYLPWFNTSTHSISSLYATILWETAEFMW